MPLTTLVAKLQTLDAFIAFDKHFLVRQGIFRNSIIRGPRGLTLDEVSQQEADHLFDVLLRSHEVSRL
jgi:4-hydroxy-tetrahydrodipicolinate synthase